MSRQWSYYQLFDSQSNNLRIGTNGGTGGLCLSTCYESVAWNFGASNTSGGSQTTWQPTADTNYIITIICSGSSPNSTTSTQTYTYHINGVDRTPASNSETGKYYFLYNWKVGTESSNTFLGEQIFYNTNHSPTTVTTMEQYLSYKWQIPIGGASTPASSSPY